jgi:hypothetical protein
LWSVGEHGDEPGRGRPGRADRGTSGVEVEQVTVGRPAGVGATGGVVVGRAGIADGEGVDGSAGCGLEVSVTGGESAKLGGGHGVGSLVVVRMKNGCIASALISSQASQASESVAKRST